MNILKSHITNSAGLENFTPRGDGGSRLEALSDGVFSLAIAILLLSSSVPKNFDELWIFVLDIIPFGICMLFIYWIWRQHITFFLRYGLVDSKITALNTILLFFVLCYVYPLKFLMSWLVKFFYASLSGNFASQIQEFNAIIPFEKMPVLMIIYSSGFVCIFLILYVFYNIAHQKKDQLKLSTLEVYETRYSRDEKIYLVGIGTLSIMLAILGIVTGTPWGAIISGWIYNLIWVVSIIRAKKRSKYLKKIAS